MGLNMATSINRKLGHVVLNVSSLARSVPFYESLLGIKEVARMGEAERKIVGAEMVFFSFGDNHHDLGLREVPSGTSVVPEALGLAHVAFKIGDGLGQLQRHAARLRALGIKFAFTRNHIVSQSIYVKDPDGILVEMYVDADPEIWRNDPSKVATVLPLDL
jgi:catechol 2,3-dioxygenase